MSGNFISGIGLTLLTMVYGFNCSRFLSVYVVTCMNRRSTHCNPYLHDADQKRGKYNCDSQFVLLQLIVHVSEHCGTVSLLSL